MINSIVDSLNFVCNFQNFLQKLPCILFPDFLACCNNSHLINHCIVNSVHKEVRYNCSAHRFCAPFHNFIIAISSQSHIKRKQPLRIFLEYSCSATMINIVKKYLRKKIHELNTLIGCSEDSLTQAQNKYIVKNHLLQNNY